MKKINKKELHEIFKNLRNKDKEAYDKLYENYYSLVYGITFSIIKNKVDCEDVTQEIFTKIYKLDVDKLPTDNEASWLFVVSKNECFLYLKKSKPNVNIDELYDIPESSNGLEEIIDITYFNHIIKGLKEDEKLIVSLKVLSDFTFKKISQIMNIPIGTVQWKYYNAINSLKISMGSLVGAIIAFVIVLTNGEILSKKQYLNKNSVEDNKENDNNEKLTTEDDSNFLENKNDIEINEENKNGIENNEENNNFNINENSSQNKDENVTEKVKPTHSINDSSNNEENSSIENFSVVPDKIFVEGSNKISNVQVFFMVVGIVFLIIFIISFKFFQQKFKKK